MFEKLNDRVGKPLDEVSQNDDDSAPIDVEVMSSQKRPGAMRMRLKKGWKPAPACRGLHLHAVNHPK